MNKQNISFLLLIGIILLGGFFNKITPINITIVLVVFFVAINIVKKPKRKSIFYVFYAFSFLFLLTPFYHEPINVDFIGYSLHSASSDFDIFGSLIRLFGYLLLAYVVAVFPIKEKQFKYIWNSLIVTSSLVALFCILEYYYGIKIYDTEQIDIIMQGELRVRGPFGDPNASSGMILPGMVVLFSNIIHEQKKYFTQLVLLLFLFMGMSTTSSRTGLVALLVAFSLFIFLRSKTLSRVKKNMLLISLVSLGGFAIGFYLKSRELSFAVDASGKVRLSLLIYTGELILEAPIFGYGLNEGFHNIFSDISVSGGITLLVLFVLLLWLIVKRLWKIKNEKNAYILLSLLIGFIIVGLGISWINNVIFWVLIGLGMNKYFWQQNKKLSIADYREGKR